MNRRTRIQFLALVLSVVALYGCAPSPATLERNAARAKVAEQVNAMERALQVRDRKIAEATARGEEILAGLEGIETRAAIELSFYQRSSGSVALEHAIKVVGMANEINDSIGQLMQVEAVDGFIPYGTIPTLRGKALAIHFALADAALKKGDLDVADAEYRYILKNYSALIYAGVRARAQVGIDDVRGKRR